MCLIVTPCAQQFYWQLTKTNLKFFVSWYHEKAGKKKLEKTSYTIIHISRRGHRSHGGVWILPHKSLIKCISASKQGKQGRWLPASGPPLSDSCARIERCVHILHILHNMETLWWIVYDINHILPESRPVAFFISNFFSCVLLLLKFKSQHLCCQIQLWIPLLTNIFSFPYS